MIEAPYIDHVNWVTLYRNLIIAFISIFFSFLIFSLTWLRSPFLFIKTTKKEIQTKNPFYFLYYVTKTCLATDDQEFWLKNISLEGYTYILFLQMQIRILFYYVLTIYAGVGLLEFWQLILRLDGSQYSESEKNIYYYDVFFYSDMSIFYMLFLLTGIALFQLNKFSRRLRFHYYYFNLDYQGEDKNYSYLERRTVLLSSQRIFHESEENILTQINKNLEEIKCQGVALSVIKLPNFEYLYYWERRLKRRSLYRFMYTNKLISKLSGKLLPKEISSQEKLENFMKKHYAKFPDAINKSKQSNYVFVLFSTMNAINDFKFVCKQNKIDIFTLNQLVSPLKRMNSYKVSTLVKFNDIYWKQCGYYPIINLNCFTWKIFVVIIFMILILFFTTPAILINFVLTNSPFVKELFGQKYQFSNDKFWIYVLQQFLPPLIVLGINRLIYFVIFRSVQRERKLRLSRYHLKISHITFFYIFINSIILPGFAIPAGSNIIQLFFGDEPVQINKLIKNFYGYTNINFFITMNIQKIFLSQFNVFTLFGVIIHYYLSPNLFLFFKRFYPMSFHQLMLRESATFNFGYYYSLNMIVFATSVIYAPHTPMITFIGMLYLFQRSVFDSHLLLNVFQNFVESQTAIVSLQRHRIVGLLLMVQICNIFVLFSDQKYFTGSILTCLFILTIVCFIIILKPYLNYKIFSKKILTESQDYNQEDIDKWNFMYQHPLAHKYDIDDKVLKTNNTSLLDQEEKKVLQLKISDIFDKNSKDLKHYQQCKQQDLNNQQNEDSNLLISDKSVDEQYMNKLNNLLNLMQEKQFNQYRFKYFYKGKLFSKQLFKINEQCIQ